MHNIWIINHYATWEGRHSFFARELSRRGHQVLLFAASFWHQNYHETRSYPSGVFYTTEPVTKGFERIWIKTLPYRGNDYRRFLNQLDFTCKTYLAGKRLKVEKPDLIIASSVHPFSGLAGYRLARRYNVPFVFEVRDLWPQTLIDLGVLGEKSLPARVFKKLEKYLYKKAEKIISLLPAADQYIGGLGIDRAKVSYIPNGIDLNWFDDKAASVELRHDLDAFFKAQKGRLVFTYTGAMGQANGLDTLLEAAKLVAEKTAASKEKLHFLLIGDGPEKERLMEKAKALKLANMSFLESVQRSEVPAILCRSDVCVSIVKKSRVHRYGVSMNKLFDYMASGRPMISALNSCFDFAEKARCGLAAPADEPAVLAEAVLKMAETSLEKRQELGRLGRNYVEKYHDYRKLTTDLLAVVEASLAGGPLKR